MTAAEKTTPINLAKTEGVEWEFDIELGSNKISAALDYTDAFEGWLSRAPALYSPHPDLSALVLHKIKGKRIEGFMVQVKLTYECNDTEATFPGRPAGKIKLYTIEPTTGEESVETFYKLKDLVDNSKEAIADLIKSPRGPQDFTDAIAKIGTDPLALFVVQKIRLNIEHYYHAGIMWVERFTSKTLLDMEVSKFYKIDEPPGAPPTLGADANWLYIPGSANPNADGKTWAMERRWLASLPTGWDPWLYGTE